MTFGVGRYCWRVRRLIFLALVIVPLCSFLVRPLGAHSEVFERAPASGQAVGGTVDHVDISFWVPVATADITLQGPDGEAIPVGPSTLSANKRVASVDFSPLTEPGNYIVTHTELSDDGDTQTAQFGFIYDPDSGEELQSLIARESGPNWLLLGGVAGVVLVLAGLFWPGRSSKKG